MAFAQSVQGRLVQSTVYTAPPSGADRTLACAYDGGDWMWRFGRAVLSGKSIDGVEGLAVHPCQLSWRRVGRWVPAGATLWLLVGARASWWVSLDGCRYQFRWRRFVKRS
jgi:hypothetical protein